MSEKMTPVDGADDVYDLDELLGAYALDAVDEDERRRVEDYLRINPKAAAEVQEHRETATMLAFTGMDAPEAVWSKITDELEAEAPVPRGELAQVLAGPPTADIAASSNVTALDERRSRRSVGTWVLGAAAAVMIAVAGTVVLMNANDQSSPNPLADAMQLAMDDRDSTQATLVAEGSEASALGVIDQDGHGYLDAGALPTLDGALTYQLWGVLAANGDVVSLGILGPNPELETFTVEGDVAALAVTIEQAPGVVSDGNPDGAYVGELS